MKNRKNTFPSPFSDSSRVRQVGRVRMTRKVSDWFCYAPVKSTPLAECQGIFHNYKKPYHFEILPGYAFLAGAE